MVMCLFVSQTEKDFIGMTVFRFITVMAAHADAAASSSHKLCCIFVLICHLFALMMSTEACIAINTLINIEKGRAGIGLSAADLKTITTHNIFPPSSQTKRH